MAVYDIEILYKIDLNPFINLQEAMENFVFPNEIKTKLMKMNKLINIIYAKEPNILRERA